MQRANDILDEALQLPVQERARVIDALLLSLDQPDAALDRVLAFAHQHRRPGYWVAREGT